MDNHSTSPLKERAHQLVTEGIGKEQHRRRSIVNRSVIQSTKCNIFMAVFVIGLTIILIEPGKC